MSAHPSYRCTGRSSSEQQTQALGSALADCTLRSDLIGLIGELGTGKTQFVKGLASGMGLDPSDVVSPTFVLVREHELPEAAAEGKPSVLVHIDAYRLGGDDDLESIGWEADLAEPASQGRRDALVVVEWADRIRPIGPNRLEIHFQHDGDDTRIIQARPLGNWKSRADQLSSLWQDMLEAEAPDAEPTRCPSCNKPVVEQSSEFPFCGERCRLVDLNRWIQGDYRISRPIEQSDLEEE